MRKRELVALLLLSFGCFVTVNVMWLFQPVPCFGLQFFVVLFPDHTHLLFVSMHILVKQDLKHFEKYAEQL